MATYSQFIEEFFQALGRIAVNNEFVHHWMRKLLGTLISNDETLGDIIAVPLPSHLLPKYLVALYEYKVKNLERLEGFRILIKDIEKEVEKRGDLIHEVWSISSIKQLIEGEKPRVKFTGKVPKDRGLKVKPTRHTISDLNSIADKLYNFAWQLEANITWYMIDKANIPLQLKILKEQNNEKNTTQTTEKI